MTEAELVLFDDTAPAWERAFYAFLAEKERGSGSRRTVDAYSSTLQRFFGRLGKPGHQPGLSSGSHMAADRPVGSRSRSRPAPGWPASAPSSGS